MFTNPPTLSRWLFSYHNVGTTFENGQAGLSITNDANWDHLTFKNNIWQGTEYGFYHWLDNTASLTLNQDYDLIYSGSSNAVLFDGNEYTTTQNYFNAIGLCQNCIDGNPSFVDLNNGDYHLVSSSPAIDAGIIIKGVNDSYVGLGPDIGAFESQLILPVLYLRPFMAIKDNNKVRLEWSTSDEIDADYFDIKRSKDGVNWKTIGYVESNNTSFHYMVLDNKPFEGVNFYKLKQYDIDGSFTYSNIVNVTFEKIELTINPNPNEGHFILNISTNKTGEIKIINSIGQIVFLDEMHGIKKQVDISFLVEGTYFVEYISDHIQMTKKIIIYK